LILYGFTSQLQGIKLMLYKFQKKRPNLTKINLLVKNILKLLHQLNYNQEIAHNNYKVKVFRKFILDQNN